MPGEAFGGTQAAFGRRRFANLSVGTDQFRLCETNKKHRERAGRDGRCAHEKAGEKSVTAEIRRKAPKEHRRTQGWLRQEAILKPVCSHRPVSARRGPIRSIDKELVETVAALTRRQVKSLSPAEIRRKAPKEHRRTQGWLRQVAMPGEASGDARLPSAGGDFEACLFAQTSFCTDQ